VPEDVALAGVEQREHALLGALLLAILAIIAVGIAFSRHQAGAAASQAAIVARRDAALLARREALLRAVVNAYPGALLLVRTDGTVGLVNARFAGEMGTDTAAFIGHAAETILPASWRSPVGALLRQREAATTVRTEFRDSQQRWHAASVVPLAEGIEQDGAALVLIDDITDQVEARDRRSRVYRGIVDILLEAIDLRDPAAAAHSRRVGALAREVALTLGADDADVETADLAGSLQGASKLFVPGALLRKADSLSDDERLQVDEAAQRWLGLLAQISVDFPVAAVCKLAHDVAHGRRPAAEGGVSLKIAYVVAAANAYVALTSSRAYRAARPRQDALDALAETLPSLPGDILKALRQSTELRAGV
jgi:PAS domain S-box-containing protein